MGKETLDPVTFEVLKNSFIKLDLYPQHIINSFIPCDLNIFKMCQSIGLSPISIIGLGLS